MLKCFSIAYSYSFQISNFKLQTSIMALISIEGMRFRAFHGLYPEEQVLGSDFLLDVWIDTDISKARTVVEDDTVKLDRKSVV